MKIIGTAFVISFLLFSCNSEKQRISQNIILPTKVISEINDSIFFGMSLQMIEDNGEIYYTDYKNDRIMVLDHSYTFKRFIGESGRGPGEFSGANGTFISGSKLYIYEDGNGRVSKFSKEGVFLDVYPDHVVDNGYFIINEGSIVASNSFFDSELKLPLFSQPLEAPRETKRFGKGTRSFERININKRREFFLVENQDYIFAVAIDDPSIEIYDKSLNKIKTKILTGIPYIEKNYKRIIQYQQDKPRVRTVFMSSIAVRDDKLYLVLTYKDESKASKQTTANHLLVFKIEGDDIILEKELELKDANEEDIYVLSFCVFEDKLLAFDNYSFNLLEYQIQ